MTQETRKTLVALRAFLPPEENNRITVILGRCSCFLEDDEAIQLIFWIVWNWATKQEWWVKFITYALNHEAYPLDGIKVHDFCAWLVEPTRFSVLVVDFLREKGEKG